MGNTLGELCTITKGITGIQKAIPGQYPLVVTAEERKSHNEYQFNDEAVIVPLVSGTGHGHASINRIHFQTGKFALGSILCAIIPKDKNVLNAEYLFRFLNLNKDNELVARMKGMANVTLPIKEIAKIEIPLPSVAEQIKFLEKYNLLEGDSQSIELEFKNQLSFVKQLRQAFLSEAMQGKLATAPSIPARAGREAETGQQLLARIKAEKAQLIKDKKLKKEKELPPIRPEEIPFEIPKDWVWARGTDVAQYIDPQPSHRTPAVSKDGVPYIAMSDIRKDGTLDFNSARKVSFGILKEHKNRYKLVNGDFIFGKIGTIGKPVILPEPFEYTLSANVIVIQPNRNIIVDRYLFYFLGSPIAEKNLIDKKSTTSYPVFGMAKARDMLIPLPPLSVQKKIVAKLDELMKTCDDLENSIKQSQIQNEQLLQQVLKEALEVREEVVN
jgi:type I restriction enzyme S subunit